MPADTGYAGIVRETVYLRYANATGRRWVVLGSGREWRLYDQHIPGLPVDKLVATATLENAQETAAFLHAIGKQSMQTGRVDVYARRRRLSAGASPSPYVMRCPSD